MWLSRSTTAARAASVCCVRSPKLWLGLLSTTTTATELSGSRCSRVSDGLASASTISASASVRIAAPRLRETNKQQRKQARRGNGRPQFRGADQRSERNTEVQCSLLLPQPLEQRRHVHLIRLVVAGERVHDDIDAGAERHFPLARLALDHRQHRLAVGPRRPGAGKVVRRNEDSRTRRRRRARGGSPPLRLRSPTATPRPKAGRYRSARESRATDRTSWSRRDRAAPARVPEYRARREFCAVPACPDCGSRRRVRAAPRRRRGCRTERCRRPSCRCRCA